MVDRIAVYSIRGFADEYQTLEPKERWKVSFEECGSLKDKWVIPEMYIYNPENKLGDFPCNDGRRLTLNARAIDVLDFFVNQPQIELLSLKPPFDDHKILHVTHCSECVNTIKSDWKTTRKRTDGTISYSRPTRLFFVEEQLPEHGLFRISQNPSRLLAVVRSVSPETDFKKVVEDSGLQGLRFSKLWSIDASGMEEIKRLFF